MKAEPRSTLDCPKACEELVAAPAPKLDADGQAVPLPADTSRRGDLTRYVGLLDATRQIGHLLGYGPLGGTAGGEEE
jgi:hypothetical protein